MRRALVVASHSDDPIIGMGGTIKKLTSNDYEILVLSVCGDRILGFEDSVRLLGAIPMYLNYSYGNIDIEKFKTDLEKIIEDFNPKIVFTHWHEEILYDHQVVARQTLELSRKYEKKIYMFEIPASSLEFEFDTAVDISEYYRQKVNAIQLMRHAFEKHVYSDEILPSILYTSGFRGVQVGCRYAEVFKSSGSRFPLAPYRNILTRTDNL
ncbi:hypothetical protein MNL76_10305 [Fervidobacterium riparium]|uniref:PIG-L deacetylase family protein n=1 Tax=Fervidobacterium gondwanense TaxID=44754 RepID=UPI0021FB6E34|nr:hypothetical protein IB67_05260 [Fervidobacterium riparium]